MSLSQGKSIWDAFLTAGGELIIQFKRPGSCEHCPVEFNLGHVGSITTSLLRSIISPWLGCTNAVVCNSQCMSECGGGRAVLCKLSTPRSCFHGDSTASPYFAWNRVHYSRKLWSALSHQNQALLIILRGYLLFIEAEFPEHHCVSQVKNVGTQNSLWAEEDRLSCHRHRGADCLLIQSPASPGEINNALSPHSVYKKACSLPNHAK